jgi:hypothetical protein
MKEEQKDSYESGILPIFVSKQCEKVKERCSHSLSVFPSIKPKLIHSLITAIKSTNPYNVFNGTSFEKILKRAEAVEVVAIPFFHTIYGCKKVVSITREKILTQRNTGNK